jgi:hypothetical protein
MGGGWATLAFLIFGFIILAYLLLQIYDRLRQDARQQPVEAPQLRSGVDELVRELRQAAEQINADMTTRANTLQKLVDDANEALKRLDAAAQRASLPAPAHRRGSPPRTASARPANGREAVVDTPRERTAAGGHVAEPVGRSAAAEPSSGASGAGARERAPTAARAQTQRPQPASPRKAAPPPPLDRGPWPGAPAGSPTVQIPRVAAASPAAASAYRQSTTSPDPFVGVDLTDTGRFQAVRRLADQGMSAAEIARSIGLGREEVELIMRVSGEGAS